MASHAQKQVEPHHAGTLGINTVIDVYHFLLEQGMPEADLHGILNIDESHIANADARVSITCLSALWDAAFRYTQDAAVGLRVGSMVKAERLSIVAQTLFQSENLQQGLEQYIRFMRLVNESVMLQLSIEGDQAKLAFLVEPGGYHRSELERTVAAAVARARTALGPVIRVNKVAFAHADPGYADIYRDVFDAPIEFDAETTALFFDRSLLAARPKKRNPYVYQALIQHAEQLLRRLTPRGFKPQAQTQQDGIERELRETIRKNLAHHKLDVDTAAKQLHMSRHTLYRKLKKSGLSFQALLESERHAQALHLLTQSTLSVSEVAFLLGFSELSAFSRAFKRWTGESPAQYRNKHVTS